MIIVGEHCKRILGLHEPSEFPVFQQLQHEENPMCGMTSSIRIMILG